MTQHIARSAGGRLALEGAVTIRTIETIHAQLVALLDAHDHIEIDCAALSETDLSLVQLLLSARKSAQTARKTLALTAPASGALHDVLLRSGLLVTQGEKPDEDLAFWFKGATA